MTNTELINAYLDNELSAADRSTFEQRLQGDSELQQELALQKDIIEGIRVARKTELKQMLNNVPVGHTTFWSTGKIVSVLAIVAVAVVGVVYFNQGEDPTPEPVQETLPPVTQDQENTDNTMMDNTVDQPVEETITEETSEEPVEETTEVAEVIESQPEDKRPVVAPDFERNETERTDIIAPGGTILGQIVDQPTETEVEIDRANTSYAFHYAFEPGMLKLFGDFDNELYEILEFNSSEGRNWFLEYEDKYYFLDDSTNGIQPLQEIKDERLLNILRNID
jgi:hypothetical protein